MFIKSKKNKKGMVMFDLLKLSLDKFFGGFLLNLNVMYVLMLIYMGGGLFIGGSYFIYGLLYM